MAALVRINETNGDPPGQKTLGISNLNFGSIDAPNIVPLQHPIRRGQCSFDKWIKLEWYGGSANKLSNFRFWRGDESGGPGPTIQGVIFKGQRGETSDLTYVKPSQVEIVGDEVPAVEGSAWVVGPAELTSPGETYYVRVQMKTTEEAALGLTPTSYFFFSYDEL